MKKILGLAIAANLMLTGSVLANGMVAPCPTPAAVKWSGFKFGAQLGYAHALGDARSSYNVVGSHTSAFTGSVGAGGVLGGLHAGYDFHLSPTWIAGVEVNFDATDIDEKHTFQAANLDQTTNTYESDWTVSVMGRLGHVMNDSLFYIGAGWAGANWDMKSNIVNIPPNAIPYNVTSKDDDFLNGFRISLGAAQRMNNWLFGVEGSYTWFEKLSKDEVTAVAAPLTFVNTSNSIKPRVLDARFKVSYMLVR